MSWLTGKSIATFQDIFDRTAPISGYTFTLNSGQTITGSKQCINIGTAQIKLSLDLSAIPLNIDPKRLARREWLIPSAITPQTVFMGFASPLTPGQSVVNNLLYYSDASLDGVVYFNPLTITGGTVGSGDPKNPQFISMGSGCRPTGALYSSVTDRFYVNSFNGGGLTVISCSANTVTKTIPYGTDGSFSRGSVFLIDALNEIWAVGNSGFLRIDANTEIPITGSSFTATGSIYATSVNNKIYVTYDGSNNYIKVYDLSLNLITTITGMCQNFSNSGNYTSRGIYTDFFNNKIYLGEISTTGGIIIVDAVTDTISSRYPINKEGFTYASPGVIAFHPLRNSAYVGGSLFTNSDASDAVPRVWEFDIISGITQTITPSVNVAITSIIPYTNNGIINVYIGSQGEVPESVPNTNQYTDGVIQTFN